ncbi:hypothetical protein [Kordia sp.]|uniref:hypothetical protein n=1 Tax=Kordia sp. TaxID=1965332 RepID=UPI003D2A37D4
MITSAFQLGEEILSKTLPYKLHQDLWRKYDFSPLDLNYENWTTIKYLNNDCSSFSDEINTVPNNCGGLYLFTIKCSVINKLTEYPVYIGRAQYTANQNLRKRCREYFTKYLRSDERPLITKMLKYWGNELYLSFITIDENIEIVDLEKKIINSLLLPFNSEIPDVEIRQAVAAF